MKGFESYGHYEKQISHSETENYGAQKLGFGTNHSTLCSGALKLPTKSFYPSSNHMKHVNEKHNHSGNKVYNSEMEKSRVQELDFGNNYSTVCFGPLKGLTPSFYQLSSTNHVNIDQHPGKSLMHEHNQRIIKSNRILFVGRVVLKLVITRHAFCAFMRSSIPPNHILILIPLKTSQSE